MLAGLGKGAVSEALEFLAALHGGSVFVGGFESTGWDLVFDVAGCLGCAVFLVLSHAPRRPGIGYGVRRRSVASSPTAPTEISTAGPIQRSSSESEVRSISR